MTDLSNKIFTLLNETESGLLREIKRNDHRIIIPHNGRGIAFSIYSDLTKNERLPKYKSSQVKLINFYENLHEYIEYAEEFAKSNDFDLLSFDYAKKGKLPTSFYGLKNTIRVDASKIGIGVCRADYDSLKYFISFCENKGFDPLKSKLREVQKIWENYNKSTIGGKF